MRRFTRALVLVSFFAVVAGPAASVLAGPRSGGSFGGRGGFRSGSGSSSRSYSGGRSYGGGGTNVIVTPGLGWGWGGFGWGWGGGGGFGFMGTLMMVGVLGLGTVMVLRAMRSYRGRAAGWDGDDDEEAGVAPSRAFVYKVQLGLGRSAREIQVRLAEFAAQGDTSTEEGLARLLQQTALELMRQKDVIRYGGIDASGPMSLTNGETRLNAMALAERSRFQVERVRGADGKVNRSGAGAVESSDALEYILVTLVLATRNPLGTLRPILDREQLEPILGALGGVAPQSILGLEVIWTPADEGDALTNSDLMTTYPDLRSL